MQGTGNLADTDSSRTAMLLQQVHQLSKFAQPCDITFFNRPPLLDVTISPKYGAAMMYGAGPMQMAELLNEIELTSGITFSVNEIWTINQMPKSGLTAEALAAVDLDEGNAVAGPNGETLRQMVCKTYHCQTEAETDSALRRYLAG